LRSFCQRDRHARNIVASWIMRQPPGYRDGIGPNTPLFSELNGVHVDGLNGWGCMRRMYYNDSLSQMASSAQASRQGSATRRRQWPRECSVPRCGCVWARPTTGSQARAMPRLRPHVRPTRLDAARRRLHEAARRQREHAARFFANSPNLRPLKLSFTLKLFF